MDYQWSKLAEAYKDLVEEAYRYNQSYWVTSGNSLDQLNTMLGVLAVRLEALETKLQEK